MGVERSLKLFRRPVALPRPGFIGEGRGRVVGREGVSVLKSGEGDVEGV